MKKLSRATALAALPLALLITAHATSARNTSIGRMADDTLRLRHTPADVRFINGMIAHHGQAVIMSSFVPARTTRQDIRLLAERIDVSQQDEIVWMETWLADRAEKVPTPDSSHAQHGTHEGQTAMPGMLTAQEVEQLRKSTGVEFDRHFLTFMIRHHQGALTMVAQLFGTPSSGQEPQLFEFATDVDADQRAEIARMRGILAQLPNASRANDRPAAALRSAVIPNPR